MISDYFDLENEFKDYKPFSLKDNKVIKRNIGKKICWVNKRYFDRYRGSFSIDTGRLCDARYSMVYLDNYNQDFDKRDIMACIIEK